MLVATGVSRNGEVTLKESPSLSSASSLSSFCSSLPVSVLFYVPFSHIFPSTHPLVVKLHGYLELYYLVSYRLNALYLLVHSRRLFVVSLLVVVLSCMSCHSCSPNIPRTLLTTYTYAFFGYDLCSRHWSAWQGFNGKSVANRLTKCGYSWSSQPFYLDLVSYKWVICTVCILEHNLQPRLMQLTVKHQYPQV